MHLAIPVSIQRTAFQMTVYNSPQVKAPWCGGISTAMAFMRLAKSGTLSLNELMQDMRSAGRRVYQFGFGESPFPPPPRVQQALRNWAGRTEYTPVAGLPPLREKIAEFHHEADRYPIAADQVLVAPGTKPLLYNIMHAFQPGEIYLPGPSWVSYAPQAALARHHVVTIRTSFEERWRVTPDLLEAAIRTQGRPDRQKLMVLNYPGNPDGLSYSRTELQALAKVMRAHGVWVVSDEIYALLDHKGQHVSLATIYPERTLVTTGVSKWCGAGGWRLGALILPPDAPKALFDALIGLGSETYSCAPAPIQGAALAAYQLDTEVHQFLKAQREILSAIGAAVYGALVEAGLRVHPPQGGFYLLLDFSPFSEPLAQRGLSSDNLLCERLLEDTGVALLPGSAFGVQSKALTARMAYVDFDGQAALEAMDTRRFRTANHACKMLQGIAAISNWLHNC